MTEPTLSPAVLSARRLTRHFTTRVPGRFLNAKRVVRAVDDVSLDLFEGRVTAVVGESGSGKSVLARMLARIVTPTSGELVLEGTAIPVRSKRTLDYAATVQLVLQDPYASVNPVHRIRHALERPLLIHGADKSEVEQLAKAALARVSLEPPERFMDRYAHELSGGQLQRVSIARALCVKPDVLLADEPISMLDVSVRLGILNLLRGLCDNERLAILYITHDIASARYIADETIVMYAGQIVERSHGTALVDEPTHPYTQLLISSVPDPSDPTSQDPTKSEHATFAVADVGCRFAPRCPSAMDVCRVEDPPDFIVGEGHTSHCWLHASEPRAAVEMALPQRRREGEPTTT
ncbi:MAG TPA: ABC transporter ATP-binding protein [Acidimicrobiales bacterium]|jgi:peptide/nickel transport system ATP-binding protein|nr:ABC transporter ATP-binding protein [Acidimicrobiales bacterium]